MGIRERAVFRNAICPCMRAISVKVSMTTKKIKSSVFKLFKRS